MLPIKSLAVLAALVLGNTGAALAVQSMVADGGARLRSGPGIYYRILASLPSGAIIDVGRCNSRGTWCRVRTANGYGWVAASRIAAVHAGRPGEENYGDEGTAGGGTDSYKITGPVVDKPGYCYAITDQNTMIIVPCS
jgi:uncharacterized protein YraI